jgi:hypothetical protein
MRAIAPSMPPHACPRQGRRRPTPIFFTAGEVIDFALVTAFGLKNDLFAPRQGRWRPTPRFYAASAGGVTAVQAFAGGDWQGIRLGCVVQGAFGEIKWAQWQGQTELK